LQVLDVNTPNLELPRLRDRELDLVIAWLIKRPTDATGVCPKLPVPKVGRDPGSPPLQRLAGLRAGKLALAYELEEARPWASKWPPTFVT
jgi:hypothetical protein